MNAVLASCFCKRLRKAGIVFVHEIPATGGPDLNSGTGKVRGWSCSLRLMWSFHYAKLRQPFSRLPDIKPCTATTLSLKHASSSNWNFSTAPSVQGIDHMYCTTCLVCLTKTTHLTCHGLPEMRRLEQPTPVKASQPPTSLMPGCNQLPLRRAFFKTDDCKCRGTGHPLQGRARAHGCPHLQLPHQAPWLHS